MRRTRPTDALDTFLGQAMAAGAALAVYGACLLGAWVGFPGLVLVGSVVVAGGMLVAWLATMRAAWRYATDTMEPELVDYWLTVLLGVLTLASAVGLGTLLVLPLWALAS